MHRKVLKIKEDVRQRSEHVIFQGRFELSESICHLTASV